MCIGCYYRKILLAFLVCYGSIHADPLIVNGDFETGDLTGWTDVQETADGEWSVYSGIVTPISGHPIDPPPQGTFAAVADETFISSMLLYQDVELPIGDKLTLQFIYYYNNYARFGAFFTPDSLRVAAAPNQQIRVDVMLPVADPYSVNPSDILANVIHTQPGDPSSLAPTTTQFDISAFAGQTVRIRFACVNTNGFFNFAIDAVEIIQEPFPPLVLMGKVINNRFLTQTERVHRLSWSSNGDPTIVAYHLLRNGVLIAAFSPTDHLVFDDHDRSQKKPDTYRLIAFRSDGSEIKSAPIIL